MNITPFGDVNTIINSLTEGLKNILDLNLVGLYLTGSLSYGDFNPKRSDIDFLAVLNAPVSSEKLKKIEQLHKDIEKENKKWAERIECSYVTKDMLQNTLPPKTPRPYIGEGKFYSKAPYGNEWIINLYWLYSKGKTIAGPDFKTFIKPVDIADVQKASVRDLFKEWQPKIKDPDYLKNSHYQSYVVLNLCRLLYTMVCNKLATKKISASWVKNEYPEWKNLVKIAEDWGYGKEMNLQEETINFIQFVIDGVNKKD
ncbi:MAG: aminoglycoside adenylyltransferase domain-containing protein [bacterium]